MMAGTAATSAGIRSGDKLGPALETEGREFFVYLTGLATGALDPGVCIENNLFEIVFATLTMVLKNGHRSAPFLFNITKESLKSKTDAFSPNPRESSKWFEVVLFFSLLEPHLGSGRDFFEYFGVS